jgi:hypothetical protein
MTERKQETDPRRLLGIHYRHFIDTLLVSSAKIFRRQESIQNRIPF